MIPEIVYDLFDYLDLGFGDFIGAVFWIVVIAFFVAKITKVKKTRPQRGNGHPTTINGSSGASAPGPVPARPGNRKTVASDGHTIPKSKDITCEGQYGHDHGERVPRFIVHEEPTLGYCNLNGKIVALKDCWKY